MSQGSVIEARVAALEARAVGCRHANLAEVQRVFAAPKAGTFSSCEGPSNVVERLTFGVTTIILHCPMCGDLVKHEVLGDARAASRAKGTE